MAFERPLDLPFWTLGDGDAKPALRRAVRTRLNVYGIAIETAGVDDSALMPAVLRFLALLGRLDAAPTGFAFSAAERISVVLHHEQHLERIVAAGDARHLGATADDQAATALLMNLAKVELWLGQAEGIGLGTAWHGGTRGRIPDALAKPIAAHLTALEADRPELDGVLTRFRNAVRNDRPAVSLVHYLAAALVPDEPADPLAEDRLALLHEFYGGAGNKVPKRAAETVKALTGRTSFRARLWDGLRRVWAWVKRALKAAIETGRRVLRVAREVARYAFQVASEGFRQFAGAIAAFFQHLSTAVQRNHTDRLRRVHVRREFGRDVNVISTPDTPGPYLSAYAEQLWLSAAIFRRASSVMGKAVALGLSIASAPISGAMILRALISVVRDLRQVLSYLGEISELQRRHDALDDILAAG